MTARILVVDDEKSFVETLANRLTKRKFSVSKAFSGSEAIQKLDEDPKIDVVLLDVKMPGMDGIETLRQIKTKYPLIEVIMVTGQVAAETAIEGIKLGALDYLMKPYDMEILRSKLREAASRKRKHEKKMTEARALKTGFRNGS